MCADLFVSVVYASATMRQIAIWVVVWTLIAWDVHLPPTACALVSGVVLFVYGSWTTMSMRCLALWCCVEIWNPTWGKRKAEVEKKNVAKRPAAAASGAMESNDPKAEVEKKAVSKRPAAADSDA